MQWIRFVVLTLVAIPVLGLGVGLADEARVEPDQMEPLEIIQDCLAALQEGDFGRYVDHLSPPEQKLQAGYALLVTSVWSQTSDDQDLGSDPETLLLYRALNDLVDQYSIPESQWGPEQQTAGKNRQVILNQILNPTFSAVSYGYPQPPPLPVSGLAIRETCIKSTDILDDHRQFLTVVLAEVSRPTVVSGDEKRESGISNGLSGLAAGYAALKWTLYTRGDYAVAVAFSQQDESRPTATGLERVDGCAVAQVPEAQIEFRRIDDRWKIVRLLPISMMISSTSHSPSPTHYPASPPPSVAPAAVPAGPAEPIEQTPPPYRR